jgi:hypothetical protein
MSFQVNFRELRGGNYRGTKQGFLKVNPPALTARIYTFTSKVRANQVKMD